ncbi:phosphoenolpyruvate--protein phosphotransferase [Nakamurella silvestris]|nr:phosphoenolpyruvate--protein phosphotransferase [Nakamurella silvestris]
MSGQLTGVGVGRGAVCGPVARVSSAPQAPAGETPPADKEVAKAAVSQAFSEVTAGLRRRAVAAEGTLAEVLEATAMMAEDKALIKDVLRRVTAGEPTLTAVDRSVDKFCQMFLGAGGYLAERVTDLRSIRGRVLAQLMGLPEPEVPDLSVPSVIVAEDLAPADTAALDLTKVLAVVTELGGPTSHTAIIAGQQGIPCVVRVAGAMTLVDGTQVAVDAAAGTVTTDPSEELRAEYAERARVLASLDDLTGPGATSDGHPVQLLANVGQVQDATRAAGKANEGVGLFRTEVLFLEATSAPTEAEQAAAYGAVLTAFGDRKVVVRTLDAGADKPLAFANQAHEDNPALGVRGYRLGRILPDLLDTQLAALARARAETGIEPWVMAPMIATPEEAREFAAKARSYGIATVGVMVEVPAAALRADRILAEVDFVSLGTNDLSQYTMAADRLQGALSDLLSPWQPAVLELVARVAAAGVSAGKPVGVCGESAGDPLMGLVLAGMGITSLSMAPGAVATTRYVLSRHSFAQCQVIAEAVLAVETADQARQAVLDRVDPQVRAVLAL